MAEQSDLSLNDILKGELTIIHESDLESRMTAGTGAEQNDGRLSKRPEFLDDRPLASIGLGRVSSASHLPLIGGILLLSVVLYGLGAAIAQEENELHAYASFYILPLLISLVAIGLYFISIAPHRYGNILWNWSPHFGAEYEDHLRSHWHRINHSKQTHILSFSGGAGGVLYVSLIRLLGPGIVPIPPISQPILFGGPILFGYVAIICGVTGYFAGLGLHIVIEHLRFYSRLPRLRLDPHRLIVGDTELTRLAWFSFSISLIWFACLAVVAIIFYGDFDAVTIGLFACGSLFGVMLFLVPQVYLHEVIQLAKKTLVAEIAGSLPRNWATQEVLAADPSIAPRLTLIRSVDSITEWPVDLRLVLSEIGAVLLPVAASVLSPQFSSVFSH